MEGEKCWYARARNRTIDSNFIKTEKVQRVFMKKVRKGQHSVFFFIIKKSACTSKEYVLSSSVYVYMQVHGQSAGARLKERRE